MAVTAMGGGTDNNELKAAAEETAAVVMATETEMATEMETVTAMTKMPMPTTVHPQQQ
jgi:hypothetical protein